MLYFLNKKIRLDNPHCFNHHRSGWKYCMEVLQKHADPNGILCMNYADGLFGRGEVYKEPWIGFIHNAIEVPDFYWKIYTTNNGKNGANTSLKKLISLQNFQDSIDKCIGLFTLTNYTKKFLNQNLDVPVCSLYHPAPSIDIKFSPSNFLGNNRKSIATIGHYLRNFQSIFDIKSPYRKTIINFMNFYQNCKMNDTVSIVNYMDDDSYDVFLSKNIVFLDFYDVAACNTIIECMRRSTPFITRRFPSTEEYVGKEYPLFFDSLEMAEDLLHDFDKIIEAHEYLNKLDKTKIGEQQFSDDFCNSNIYKRIPSYYKNKEINSFL